jgi:hypothetical protein
MGTFIPRKRKDGSTGYTALITLKRDGKIAHREARTFDRKQAANAWMVTRETELRKPGGLERKEDPHLSVVIDKYITGSKKQIGRTKAQVLRTIKNYPIAEMRCSEITSAAGDVTLNGPKPSTGRLRKSRRVRSRSPQNKSGRKRGSPAA